MQGVCWNFVCFLPWKKPAPGIGTREERRKARAGRDPPPCCSFFLFSPWQAWEVSLNFKDLRWRERSPAVLYSETPTHPIHLLHSCIISTSPGELNFFSKKYSS